MILSVDPVHKEDFLDRVLAECYPNGEPSIANTSSDRLSTIFMVFAVGAFFDFEQTLVPREAEDYYTLARAALCVRPIYDYPTVYAIQSMVCDNNISVIQYALIFASSQDVDDVVSNTGWSSHTCLSTTLMGCSTDGL